MLFIFKKITRHRWKVDLFVIFVDFVFLNINICYISTSQQRFVNCNCKLNVFSFSCILQCTILIIYTYICFLDKLFVFNWKIILFLHFPLIYRLFLKNNFFPYENCFYSIFLNFFLFVSSIINFRNKIFR